MTTPEQKHQKGETTEDLYQKPEIRFIEMYNAGVTMLFDVVIGEGHVGSVDIEIPMEDGGYWRVIARYCDHAGQLDEQDVFASCDEMWSAIERWYADWWDTTWKTLCGEPVQDINVQIKILPQGETDQ